AYSLIADAEVEPAVRANRDAVHAVVMINATKPAQQFSGRTIRFAVTILVLEKEDVRRLANKYFVSGSYGVFGNGDTQRSQGLGRLIKRGGLVCASCPARILQDNNAVSLRTIRGQSMERMPVVDRF